MKLMHILVACLLALSTIGMLVVDTAAQVSLMPQEVQERLRELGPGWGKDIPGNIAKTLEVYTPILAAAQASGVKVTKDIAYGSDARHRVDIFQAEGKSGVPVVVYLHGGAYVRGDRNISPEVYSNITTYFARQGFLAINGTYFNTHRMLAQYFTNAYFPAPIPLTDRTQAQPEGTPVSLQDFAPGTQVSALIN